MVTNFLTSIRFGAAHSKQAIQQQNVRWNLHHASDKQLFKNWKILGKILSEHKLSPIRIVFVNCVYDQLWMHRSVFKNYKITFSVDRNMEIFQNSTDKNHRHFQYDVMGTLRDCLSKTQRAPSHYHQIENLFRWILKTTQYKNQVKVSWWNHLITWLRVVTWMLSNRIKYIPFHPSDLVCGFLFVLIT